MAAPLLISFVVTIVFIMFIITAILMAISCCWAHCFNPFHTPFIYRFRLREGAPAAD